MGIKNELDRLIEESAGGNTQIVADPTTIKKLIDSGKIKKRFITYSEYLNKLYEETRRDAEERLSKLPLIDDDIADSVVTAIYEDIRISLAFKIPTSAIVNAIMLLEYALRLRLYKERLADDPYTEWYVLENMKMADLIRALHKRGGILADIERDKLLSFNEELRNPYLHINIQKITEGIYITKLPSLNAETFELTELENVEASKHRHLWFSAKKYFDNYHLYGIMNFCIGWTNKLLKD